MKLILHKWNINKFTDVIVKALNDYYDAMQERIEEVKASHKIEIVTWSLPEERYYNEDTCGINQKVKNHALMPFIQEKRVSNPEEHFIDFLEKNTEIIDWWYKNGDNGMEHFSIPYTNSKGGKSLFYIDFIIRLKSGVICLFDTKSRGSDPEAANKHNAFIDYKNSELTKALNIIGGVIIEDNYGNWHYSMGKIKDTNDISSWSTFFPDQIKRDILKTL